MSGRLLELQSLRRELFEVRGLLNRLESRIQALEEEAAFELVDPLPGPAAGPSSPSPGSGGGSLSRGPPLSPQPGSGGVNLSQAPLPSRLPGSGGGNLSRAFSPPDRPGSGGVDLSLAYDLASEVFPDRSSRSNPGPPNSSFRTAVAKEVGQFLRRALDGGHLRTSGRSALTLSSKYYIVLADFEGRRFSEPCVFSAFAPAKALCIRGPDKGQSIFVGSEGDEEAGERFSLQRLLEHSLEGSSPRIGELRIEAEAGPTLSCSIVVIAQFEGSFLVAVPQTAWHRTAGRRYLPRTALSRTVLAEVLAAAADDPSAMRHGVKLKVWLGMLDPALEDLVDFAVEGELSPDVPFLGFGSRASERLNPYGPALSAIASEHYAFQTPAEDVQLEGGGAPRDGEESWEHRLTSLEAAGLPLLAGLDPVVLEAARKAGVPEDQLVRMSRLALKSSAAPGAKAKVDLQIWGGGRDPVHTAVVQIGQVLKLMQKDREKKNDLEDILERAEGGAPDAMGASGSSGRSKTAAYQKLRGILRSAPEQISASIEGLMMDDFVGAQSGPHQEERRLSVRGWVEHRSHLQPYAGPIRQAWTLASIIDLLNSGNSEQAKAVALLAVAALDQAAIDNGSWLLASEFSMDIQPPFSSFQRPRQLDPLESRQSRVIDPRWISLYMSRIRERDAYHTAKRNLGGGGGGAPPPSTGESVPPEVPPKKPPKGAGRGGKGKEKALPCEPPSPPQSFELLHAPSSPGRGGSRDFCSETAPSYEGCDRSVGPDVSCTTTDPDGPVPPRHSFSGAPASAPSLDPMPESAAPPSGPGARAPSVIPSDLWDTFFDCMSRSSCKLSSFFHSIRLLPRAERGPSCTSGASRRHGVWPMPLPYPELHAPRSGGRRDPEQLGVNAVVLVLNFLFLGEPAVAGRHLRLGLGEQLTSTQRRAVDSLRIGVSAWNAGGPYAPSDLGRAAAKFEALNDMLLACQTEAESVRASGIPLSEVLFSFAAPCNVLPVEPSRLNFVGTPSFDPLPFLDSRNRATYARPLDFARDIPEDESIPRVAVRADRRQTSELLQLLDDSGRLRLFSESEIRPRLRNGLFSVAKDSSRDRMVLDARPPNQAEETETRWIRSLGTLEQFQFIYLPDDSNFEIHTEDLKEFYHAFIVGEQRARRNALALELTFEDVSHLRACSKSLRGCRIIPSLNTMAMGDLNAVALGQTAHLSVLLRSGVLRLRDFITLQGRPGRPGSQVAGLLIDDFILLDPVPRQLPSPCFEPAGVRTMRAVTESYRSSGLPRNESKAVSRAAIAEFWGGRLDGRSGLLRPGPKRTSALAQFILQLVRGGVTSVGMLEVVAGGLISALQLRRRLLSVLDSVYSVQRHRDRRAFVPVVGELCSELLVSAMLLCQVDVDLRAPAAPVLLTTDASSTAEASAAVQVPERFSLEMTRHGLQRGLWARLLSPAQADLRERGELSDSQELPEAVYVSHPLWEEVCSSLQFQQLGRTVKVKARRHINIGEVRAAVRGEERVGQDFPGRRYVHLQDSQVSLGSFVKGRAASSALNRELRRSIPGHLANRVRPSYGYIQSKLAGLPPENELWADAPIGEVPGPATARMRAVLGPEQRAASILQRAHLGAGEALEIFRRLPKELSARSTKWSRTEASFSAGVFVHGGIVGLRRTTGLFPNCIQVFTRLIREAQPGFVFSSLSVNQNVRTLPHIDKNNLSGEPNLVVPLSRFRSGGIWVLAESSSERLRHRGKDHYGEVLPVSERAVSFDPRRLHATQPWTGTRVVLIGFTVRGCEKLSDAQRAEALDLGFVLPPEPNASPPFFPSSAGVPKPLPAIRAPADLLCVEGPTKVDPPSFVGGDIGPFAASHAPRSGPASSRGFELSPELRRSLLEMPPGRFVISSAFGDLSSALSSAPGWLDLFSGSRGFAKALAAAAPCWVLCVDVSHGLDEDLLRTDLQKELLRLIRGRAFHGVSAGPVCSSFSGAMTPCWRTEEFPQGRPDLRSDQQDKVLAGNMMLEFTLEVLQAAEDAGILFWVENPQNSWFWRQRAWDILKETVRWDDFLCDMCVFGTLWRKAIIVIRSYGEETALPESAGCWLAWGFQASRHLSVRDAVQLREVATVTKATAVLRSGIWAAFKALLSYGQVLYDRGASLQEFRQLLAHCPQVVPRIRAGLKPAWDLLTKWERLEPTVHRTPMPEPILWAMIGLSVSWGWLRWAAVTLLCFLGCCRIGEVLGATRRDLLTPWDLLQNDRRFYLVFREPKTRGRGARVQHVAIDLEEHLAGFVRRVLGSLPPRELLFPGSAGVYRRRWDSVLAALDIPAKFKLTPGCLRGGGAVAAYRRKQPIADIQWTMRLQHQATLAYYLQEVSAESVLPKLSVDARKNIVATSAMLPYLLRGSPAH
ncbi:unnamed protein product [Symbiodinium sp. CCMP2592]|nr:unnamed protein product [Symbiodinium sp. CCMP2592]